MRNRLEDSRPPQRPQARDRRARRHRVPRPVSQLVHAERQPDLLRSNLWDALDALHRRGVLDMTTHAELRDTYNFLRAVEGRLRLIHDLAGTELPEDPDDLPGWRAA